MTGSAVWSSQWTCVVRQLQILFPVSESEWVPMNSTNSVYYRYHDKLIPPFYVCSSHDAWLF